MCGVVEADAEDRARHVGREQLDVVEGMVGTRGGRAVARDEAILHGRAVVEGDDAAVEDLAVVLVAAGSR